MTKTPDVVGTAETAAILGVEVPRIWRLRGRGRLPKPVAETHATAVWMRADIEKVALAMRENPRLGPWEGKDSPPLDLVGTADAAEIIGGKDFNKSQIGRWRRKGQFPTPAVEKLEPGEQWTPGCGKIGATPLWWRADVEAFAQERADAARRAARSAAAKRAAATRKANREQPF